jgi:hypothetical protein
MPMKVQFIKKNSQQGTNRPKKKKKKEKEKRRRTLKGCKTNNKMQINKNIAKVQNRQHNTKKKKKKRFLNKI